MTKAISLYTNDTPFFALKEVEQRVVLNYVSIQANSNKFYIIEFQEGVGEYSYRIYTEYGRMGNSPRKQERYFLTRLEAKNAFEKILSSKRKKGYELIVIDEEWDESSLIPIRAPFRRKPTHTISQALLFSIHTQLGKLSEIQLYRGIQILTEIEEKIHNGNTDVIHLSNQFYSVIPVVFGNQIGKTHLLDNSKKVQAKKEWLNQMISAAHYEY
ncbi:WGR domain-containing protein [Bacillus sp. JJ1474]|uniref:WGR domain-containing protein n=1 Tax=Bacillus sp. JJ1474 TaxID=3122955 RepID=UPI003000143F